MLSELLKPCGASRIRIRSKLQDLKTAGDDAWEDLKTGEEKVWSEVKAASKAPTKGSNKAGMQNASAWRYVYG